MFRFLATSAPTVDADVAQQGGDVEVLRVARHALGLDLGEVEHVVDQAEQVAGVAADLAARRRAGRLRPGPRFPPRASRCSRSRPRAACAARGSCWPGTGSWRGWRSPPPLSRSTSSASAWRRSVMSVWVPTHSRTAPSSSRIGTPRASMLRQAPSVAAQAVFQHERPPGGDRRRASAPTVSRSSGCTASHPAVARQRVGVLAGEHGPGWLRRRQAARRAASAR